MADYKQMYLALFNANEAAIDLLTKAQLECEEMYISSPEPELTVLPPKEDRHPTADT